MFFFKTKKLFEIDAKVDAMIKYILRENEILNNLGKRLNETEIRQLELKEQLDALSQANKKEFERRNAEIARLLGENTAMLEKQLKAVDVINDEIKMLLLSSVMDQL